MAKPRHGPTLSGLRRLQQQQQQQQQQQLQQKTGQLLSQPARSLKGEKLMLLTCLFL
jgi:hypothetical protein